MWCLGVVSNHLRTKTKCQKFTQPFLQKFNCAMNGAVERRIRRERDRKWQWSQQLLVSAHIHLLLKTNLCERMRSITHWHDTTSPLDFRKKLFSPWTNTNRTLTQSIQFACEQLHHELSEYRWNNSMKNLAGVSTTKLSSLSLSRLVFSVSLISAVRNETQNEHKKWNRNHLCIQILDRCRRAQSI